MLWIPGLDGLHNVLVSTQYFQNQCMLWIHRLDGLHSDPGICPMFPVPVYVVGSWAGCPSF